MAVIRKMKNEDLDKCSGVYRSAYAAEPWREEYTDEEIRKYLADFMESDSMHCFVLEENAAVIGLALTIRVPCTGGPYLRIEDFCIGAEYQKKGSGSIFLGLLTEEAKKMGCDSILLGTQRGFPSHRFYLKNGFREIETALLYRETDGQ